MAITNLITRGIGPQSTIPLLLTAGLITNTLPPPALPTWGRRVMRAVLRTTNRATRY